MLSKKNLAAIIIVVLAVIIVVAAFKSQRAKDDNENANQAPVITKTNVPEGELPKQFPTNVPIEAGATVKENYNAAAPDGRFQATRTFETKQTLAANLTLYSNYLKDNGWALLAVVDQPTYKMVVGNKDKQQLQISIDENSSSKVKTVTISLTTTQ